MVGDTRGDSTLASLDMSKIVAKEELVAAFAAVSVAFKASDVSDVAQMSIVC